MAFYGDYEQKGKQILTGDISHFRQPYKDYTSLSGFGAIAANYNKNFMGHLWYVNDTNVATALGQMVLGAADPTTTVSSWVAASGDASMQVMLLQDQPAGGQLQTTAQATILSMVAQGYAALLDTTGSVVLFTRDPKAVARLAGGNTPQASILQVDPNLGLQADALAASASSNPLSIASLSSSVGPLGVAAIVLGAAGVGYMLFHKKRRYTPNRRRRHARRR